MIPNRVILIVLDSVGVGELPDASRYGDEGSNTLGNLARFVGGLKLPNLQELGLGNIIEIDGVLPANNPKAAFGKMAEVSKGKDTTTGHWELSGIILDKPFPVYPEGFPQSLIEEFEKRIGRKTLANEVASGTEIIERMGKQHIETGYPIVYTSADSVFQIAAHEEVIPITELYQMCRIARDLLVGPHAVGRVIARPFIGEPGNFKRTANRHDYSLSPPGPTVLDVLKNKGLEVIAIGKIEDIFNGQGITEAFHTKNNMDGVDLTLKAMDKPGRGLVFTNLVEFDSSFGHRNDPKGYAGALEEFDGRVPELLSKMGERDILVITADHGCDPTTESTDHSREYVPLIVYGSLVNAGVNLGVRSSFADLGATIADLFGLKLEKGISFKNKLLKKKALV